MRQGVGAEVALDRVVETEPAVLDQAQGRRGGEALGRAGDPERRVPVSGLAVRPSATPAAPDQLPCGVVTASGCPRQPRASQTLRYGLDPYGLFESAHRAFGNVFPLHVMAETRVILAHPDASASGMPTGAKTMAIRVVEAHELNDAMLECEAVMDGRCTGGPASSAPQGLL